jgi:hypothetical protein
MFRLRWKKSAVADLARIWVAADSAVRQAITVASRNIEMRLRTDPLNEGESRSAGRRITFEPPLAVTFRLAKDGRTVFVLEVRLIRRRKR